MQSGGILAFSDAVHSEEDGAIVEDILQDHADVEASGVVPATVNDSSYIEDKKDGMTNERDPPGDDQGGFGIPLGAGDEGHDVSGAEHGQNMGDPGEIGQEIEQKEEGQGRRKSDDDPSAQLGNDGLTTT